ncbi:EamA family transporter [Mitsuokella sp. WILCCON 0060]|uniref:EamA family transporter n=1 Tax=unclassified Mitsuokella TaxID=2637239 RepID=UPI003F0D9DE9
MQYAVLVFLGGCSYGILSTIVKLAYAARLTAAEVCGSQVFFGMVLLWTVVLLRRSLVRMSPRRILTLILCGLPVGLTTMFYYTALKTVTASFAVILLFQFVWISMVLDSIITRRLPGRSKIAALVVLLPGSVLAAGFLGSGEPLALTQGIIWGLLSAVSYAFVLIVSGTVGCEVPPFLKSALMSIGAAVVVFSVMPPAFLLSFADIAKVLPYGLPLGLFGIALPPLLFAIGIPHTGPSLGSILTSSELPMALIMAFLVLGEHIAPLQWLGVVLIFLGVIIGNLRQ